MRFLRRTISSPSVFSSSVVSVSEVVSTQRIRKMVRSSHPQRCRQVFTTHRWYILYFFVMSSWRIGLLYVVCSLCYVSCIVLPLKWRFSSFVEFGSPCTMRALKNCSAGVVRSVEYKGEWEDDENE